MSLVSDFVFICMPCTNKNNHWYCLFYVVNNTLLLTNKQMYYWMKKMNRQNLISKLIITFFQKIRVLRHETLLKDRCQQLEPATIYSNLSEVKLLHIALAGHSLSHVSFYRSYQAVKLHFPSAGDNFFMNVSFHRTHTTTTINTLAEGDQLLCKAKGNGWEGVGRCVPRCTECKFRARNAQSYLEGFHVWSTASLA